MLCCQKATVPIWSCFNISRNEPKPSVPSKTIIMKERVLRCEGLFCICDILFFSSRSQLSFPLEDAVAELEHQRIDADDDEGDDKVADRSDG